MHNSLNFCLQSTPVLLCCCQASKMIYHAVYFILFTESKKRRERQRVGEQRTIINQINCCGSVRHLVKVSPFHCSIVGYLLRIGFSFWQSVFLILDASV